MPKGGTLQRRKYDVFSCALHDNREGLLKVASKDNSDASEGSVNRTNIPKRTVNSLDSKSERGISAKKEVRKRT